MKRLFIIASLAILAASCQKTEIQNEVLTPIGFSTETAKLTRAIVDGTSATYPTDQPFAVFAYGWQKETDGTQVTNGAAGEKVMDNVEVSYQTDVWKATTGSYYWPNDPRTSLNFYAYSPSVNTEKEPHQQLNGTVTHDETNGLKVEGYEHTNMYVDFMVSDKVEGATYADQNGNHSGTPTLVPLNFKHELTQVLFEVSTSEAYSGITFTVTDITLSGIGNKATYTNGSWVTPSTTTGNYNVFPQEPYSTTNTDGSPALTTVETEKVVTNTTTLTTTGVTMIPQTIGGTQKLTITYKISGDTVADEVVVKDVLFNSVGTGATVVNWVKNQKITYKLVIGLNEIKFDTPTVAAWTTTEGNTYTFQQ